MQRTDSVPPPPIYSMLTEPGRLATENCNSVIVLIFSKVKGNMPSDTQTTSKATPHLGVHSLSSLWFGFGEHLVTEPRKAPKMWPFCLSLFSPEIRAFTTTPDLNSLLNYWHTMIMCSRKGCIYLWRGQKTTLGVLVRSHPSCLEAHWLISRLGWPASPSELLASTRHMLRLQDHPTACGSVLGHSSGFTLVQHSSPTEPSSQPV